MKKIYAVLLCSATFWSCGEDELEVPEEAQAYCDPVSERGEDFVEFEERVVALVNQHRLAGANCGSAGTFAATHALALNASLRCAARKHAVDMGENDYFSHTNLQGEGPSQRIEYAGYKPQTWGENIAYGQATPEAVMDAWMKSDGHCSNIMSPNFTEIGVGYDYTFDFPYWVQNFGDQQ